MTIQHPQSRPLALLLSFLLAGPALAIASAAPVEPAAASRAPADPPAASTDDPDAAGDASAAAAAATSAAPDAPSPGHTVRATVVVTALRGGAEAPITRTSLGREELAERDHGQDLPLLLATTPSATASADAGVGGSGYSYLSLRGIGQNRLNVTLDGVPLNDPEENWVFFADLWDLASSLASVEVQRGVGTSSVGTASYAGALSLESLAPAADFGGAARLAVGELGTRQGAIGLHSGRLLASADGDGGLALYGRYSSGESDGWRERSGARQETAFWNADWRHAGTTLRLTGVSGRLRSELAYLASEEAALAVNPRDNPLGPDERDDFRRDLALLQLTQTLGARTVLTATVYRNAADGWFRVDFDPAETVDLAEYGLDWETWGGLVTVSHDAAATRLDAGLHASDFRSHHGLDASITTGRTPVHRNRGDKRETSAFVKLGRDLAGGRVKLFADAEVRHARFAYHGRTAIEPVDWTFVNPKLGARYLLRGDLALYASLGRVRREPARTDLLAGEDDASIPYDLTAVRPERLTDLELGAELHRGRLALAVNLFAMEFRDEIAATGELSEVGLPLRRNVDESFRRGIEIEGRYAPSDALAVELAASWLHARIRRWNQSVDLYAEDGSYAGSVLRTYRDVPPLLSPELVLRSAVRWHPTAAVELAMAGRYVAASQLDNTGDRRFRTPSYTDLTLDGRWALPWQPAGLRSALRLTVDNLLDEEGRYASGYSYRFATPTAADQAGTGVPVDGLRYYYPLAGRRAQLALELAW